jgi:hypothetical protein
LKISLHISSNRVGKFMSIVLLKNVMKISVFL